MKKNDNSKVKEYSFSIELGQEMVKILLYLVFAAMLSRHLFDFYKGTADYWTFVMTIFWATGLIHMLAVDISQSRKAKVNSKK